MSQVATRPPRAAAANPARQRLRLLAVIFLVVGLTLSTRLVWLQTSESDRYAAAAQSVQSDVVEVPAPRGAIVDRDGEVLAGNRTAYMVVATGEVDEATLQRVSEMTDTPEADLRARLAVCGQPGAEPGRCFTGAPGEPIPIVPDLPIPEALALGDADLTGIDVQRTAVREYPSRVNAAGVLGYLAQGTGQSGLEGQYEQRLRGVPGEARRQIGRDGATKRVVTRQPIQGQTLRTTLDIPTQAVAEDALREAVLAARSEGYRAVGGSVVVMEAGTGAIRAMASYPTYNPNIWSQGVSQRQYARLTDESGGRPLVFRPTQAVAPPASTFKPITTVAADNAGFDLNGIYDCPAYVVVGGRTFTNYQSRAYGPVSLSRALSVSCDTVFYRFGYRMWKRDGGLTGDDPQEHVVRAARDFGIGQTTGIDLLGEVAGGIPDRADVQDEYDQRRDDYCRRARTGYPEEPKKARAALLKRYARDYCRTGYQYKAGDAMNTAIGQGRTLATPVQMAVAYAAIANGGKVVTPHLAQSADAPVVRRVDAEPAALAYIRRALASTTVDGTASGAFAGFPLDRYPVAAKTGTAEVEGRQTTSWLATFAPAEDAQYVVVVNVDEGGLGAATSGPVARAVYEHVFGVKP